MAGVFYAAITSFHTLMFNDAFFFILQKTSAGVSVAHVTKTSINITKVHNYRNAV